MGIDYIDAIRQQLKGTYGITVETRGLYADCTPRYMERGKMLLHSVVVDDDGNDSRVLCGRVRLDNFADANADPDSLSELPTCKRCLTLLAELEAKHNQPTPKESEAASE